MKTRISLGILGTLVPTVLFADVVRMKPDARTSFLVQPEEGAIVDVAGKIPAEAIRVSGVTVEKDPVFGEVMVPQGGKCGVTVPDEGRIAFRGGATLEALVWLEPGRKDNVSIASKDGRNWQRRTFAVHVTAGDRFTLDHYATKDEPIDFTEEELKHHWGFRPDSSYGGLKSGTNGNTPVATGKWVRVAWTYDEKRALVRTWVDGSIDREFFEREPMVSHELADEDDAPVVLFSRAQGVRIAQVRLSQGARLLGVTPPVRVFVHESPYWKKGGYVHVKPVADDLPLPVEIEVMNVHIPFMAKVNRATLDSSTEAVNVPIPKHDFNNAWSDLVVKLKKDGRELWRQECMIGNPSPCSQEMADFYSGRRPYPSKATKPEWNIGEDNTFYYKGRPLLPIKLYFARPANWELVTELGFNMIGFRGDKGQKPWQKSAMIEPFYAKAAEKGVTLCTDGDVAGRPGQGFDMAFDEPYSYNFERFRRTYLEKRATRARSSLLPVYSSQNNQTRYRETSMCCDVLGPDPYNKGRTPFRGVYDAILGAVLQVDDRKPVMSVIGNYGTDRFRPDPEDLRTMCYLSIEAGARALSFYSWDEGEEPGGPMDTTCKPQQIEAYRRLFAEFRTIDPALTVPNVKDAVRIEPAQPRGFFACAKKGRDRKVYLIVSSDLYRSTAKTVVMPSAADRRAKLLFGPWREGMKMEASKELVFDAQGKAQLSLPPVSSAVYVFEKAGK